MIDYDKYDLGLITAFPCAFFISHFHHPVTSLITIVHPLQQETEESCKHIDMQEDSPASNGFLGTAAPEVQTLLRINRFSVCSVSYHPIGLYIRFY